MDTKLLEGDVMWRVGGIVDRQLRHEEGIKTNGDYRLYLQRNANSIVSLNQNEACRQVSSYCSFDSGVTTDKSVPFLYPNPASESTPPGYETSDLKQDYLAKYRARAARAPVHLGEEVVHHLKGAFAAQDLEGFR
jgi:hypothetical protein